MSPEYGKNLGQDLPGTVVHYAEIRPPLADNLATHEIKPAVFNKTPLMLAVEQKFALPGESVADLLKRLYIDEQQSLTAIRSMFNASGDFSVSKQRLSKWMNHFHPDIKIRQLREVMQNPEQEEYRISRIKAAWKDPVKKKQLVAKIHNPESEAKRNQARSDSWSKHPVLEIETIRHLTEGRKKKSAKRSAEFLGTDPYKTLAHLLDVEGLTVKEIANKAGRSVTKVRGWLEEFGVTIKTRHRRVATGVINARRTKVQETIESNLFGLLSERQQQVLGMLYSQTGVAPTQSRVANKLHLSRQRIGQLDNKGLAKLDRLLEFGPEGLKRHKKQQAKKPPKIDSLLGDNPASTLAFLYIDQGLSLSDIAAKLGCSHQTLWRRLKALNIPTRARGRPRKN